jgi:hypothetical protein
MLLLAHHFLELTVPTHKFVFISMKADQGEWRQHPHLRAIRQWELKNILAIWRTHLLEFSFRLVNNTNRVKLCPALIFSHAL